MPKTALRARATALPRLIHPDPAPFFEDLSVFPDRYAMKVSGDCLELVVRDGATILMDKTAPISTGDLVLIYRKREIVPPGKLQAVVKRVVIAPPPWITWPYRDHPQSDVKALIIVEMLNPRWQFAYRCEDLIGVHRCVGPMPADAETYPASLKREARHG